MRVLGLERREKEDVEEELEQKEEREEAEWLRECVRRRWKVDGEREGG